MSSRHNHEYDRNSSRNNREYSQEYSKRNEPTTRSDGDYHKRHDDYKRFDRNEERDYRHEREYRSRNEDSYRNSDHHREDSFQNSRSTASQRPGYKTFSLEEPSPTDGKSLDTIYITGLPPTVTEASLAEFFGTVGVIKVF